MEPAQHLPFSFSFLMQLTFCIKMREILKQWLYN